MNIAELKGEKTVRALAKRLLAAPTKRGAKTTSAEMEDALLRLNPQLEHIGRLKKGTPIIVPDDFSLNPAQSSAPMRSLGETLLRRTAESLESLRGFLEEQDARSRAEKDDLGQWLKKARAKQLIKQTPKLKKTFASAAKAAKTLPKEQATRIAAQKKGLAAVENALAVFRSHHS